MMIFYAFVALFITYYLINYLYSRYWDYKLSAEVILPKEQVFEGSKTSITQVVTNNKFLPLPTLETRFVLDKGLQYIGDTKNTAITDKLYRRDVFSLGIKQKVSRTFDIICTKRGYYTLSSVDLIAYDVFLNNKIIAKNTFHKYFYVFPRRVESSKIALPFRQIQGDLAVRKLLIDDPFCFAGIRDYTPTDTLNSINWKASAKSGDLVVNTYDSTSKQKVLVFLDTYDNDTTKKEWLNEEAIRVASSLIERLLHIDCDVTFVSNAIDVVTNKNIELYNLNGLLTNTVRQHLSRITLGAEKPLDDYLDMQLDSTYTVIISKNLDVKEKIESNFENFYWILPYSDFIRPLSMPKDKLCLWNADHKDVE
ncbi:MAG: DUF58 domain-containing protein [Clostridia bacterium]